MSDLFQSFLWNGLVINNPFDLPEAVVQIYIEGMSDLEMVSPYYGSYVGTYAFINIRYVLLPSNPWYLPKLFEKECNPPYSTCRVSSVRLAASWFKWW